MPRLPRFVGFVFLGALIAMIAFGAYMVKTGPERARAAEAEREARANELNARYGGAATDTSPVVNVENPAAEAGASPQDGAAEGSASFRTSTITASRDAITPLQTIDYTITIRNEGTRAASYLHVANAIPPAAMFVSASPEWKFIEADRSLDWYGRVEPGQSQVLRLSLVTKPESAGSRLSNRAEIHYDGRYWALEHALDVDSPVSQAGMQFGRYNVTPVGMVALPFLFVVLALVFLSFFGVYKKTAGGVMLLVISTGMLLMFGMTARNDIRMKNDYRETRCTVTDSLARFSESADSSRPGTRSRSSGTWSPLFALKYPTPQGELVSIGYASESRLQFGSPKPTQLALMQMPRGATAPCWYDPADPKRVVLDRSIGGAYGFALIPLVALALGGWLVFGRARGR